MLTRPNGEIIVGQGGEFVKGILSQFFELSAGSIQNLTPAPSP
jgi:hypothetical protein